MCLYFPHTLCLAEPSDVSCISSACPASTVALAPRAVALYFLEISWKSNFILAFSLCLAPEDRYSVDKPPCFPCCFTQSPPHLTLLLFPVISRGAGSSLGCQERSLTHTHTWLRTEFRPKAETFVWSHLLCREWRRRRKNWGKVSNIVFKSWRWIWSSRKAS